jgi:hypothetical protein
MLEFLSAFVDVILGLLALLALVGFLSLVALAALVMSVGATEMSALVLEFWLRKYSMYSASHCAWSLDSAFIFVCKTCISASFCAI